MPMPRTKANRRKATEKSLKTSLASNKLSEKYLEDKIDEYMSFYDDLEFINELLARSKEADEIDLKTITSAIAEKRRISNEMRNILRFLGLKPSDSMLPSEEFADEEL